MAAVKEETWLWIAMAAALVAAVWWYRKRKPIAMTTTIPTGVGSTIGSTVANQPSVGTVQSPGPLPPFFGNSNSTTSPIDPGGQVTAGLGGGAPVTGVSVSGTPVVSLPIFVRKGFPPAGGGPIYSPRLPGAAAY